MRFLFLFLFLFSLPSLNSAWNCTDIHCCLDRTVVERSQAAVYDASEENYLYRLIGVSRDCHVFYGWLHQVYPPKSDSEQDKVQINASNNDCFLKRIFYIRTQGLSREMILLVDSAGRRVRLQNVMSFSPLKRQEPNLVWLKVNPTNRRTLIYTGPVHQGYDIVTSFNANYRLFIAARSNFNIRIYEVSVYIDDDNTPHATLRENYYDLNPILFPPLDQFLVRVVSMQNTWEAASGLTIVPWKNIHSTRLNSTTAIPFQSMLMGSLRSVETSHSSEHYVYQSKYKHFVSRVNRQCDRMFTYMFYYKEINANDFNNAHWVGFAMSTQRTLNARNVHRRMSYPHTFKRKRHLEQLKGWLEQIGVFLGFVFGIGLLATILNCMTGMVQRELKRRSSTSSTHTH